MNPRSAIPIGAALLVLGVLGVVRVVSDPPVEVVGLRPGGPGDEVFDLQPGPSPGTASVVVGVASGSWGCDRVELHGEIVETQLRLVPEVRPLFPVGTCNDVSIPKVVILRVRPGLPVREIALYSPADLEVPRATLRWEPRSGS